MELRPYQQEAREAVKSDWASGFLRTLLVLPTGCGKTIVFSKIVEDMVRSGRRCLILAHRGELLDQAADKLLQATGLRCSVEKAEETCLDSWYRVTVGSIQSLMREKRLGQFPADYFDVIVVDEAHHALSDGYQRVLTYFEEARVLGVTAAAPTLQEALRDAYAAAETVDFDGKYLRTDIGKRALAALEG